MAKRITTRKRRSPAIDKSALNPGFEQNVKQNKKYAKAANRSEAFDFFRNAMARTGLDTPSLPQATEYVMERLSNDYWLLLTLYRNHWIARRIVDLPAQDMVRAWATLTCEIPPEDISKFDRTVARTYTPRTIQRCLEWAGLYGGAGALMAIRGHEDYLDEPLDLDDVNPGSYMGLIPFDRWVGIYPETNVADKYDRPLEWGEPGYYRVQGPDTGESFRVHSTRILKFCGPGVPTPELQAQNYWGISKLEPVFEDLRKRDNSSWAVLNLMMRANIIARVEPALEQLLSGLGTTQQALKMYQARMQAQNELLSNQSMLVMGKDASLESVSYSFAGMAEVMAQFQMDVAGAAGIPVTRLFGRTISGLGQSNDADERYYEERIAMDQNSDLRPALDKLYPVICMSEFGEVPDDLDFKFPSVRVLTEEEKADLTEKASAPILATYNSGLISARTTLRELKQISETTGVFSNITDEEIDAADDEPITPGEGEMPGEEGEEGGEGEESEPAKEGPEAKAGEKSLPNPQRMLKKASAGAEDSEPDEKKKWKEELQDLNAQIHKYTQRANGKKVKELEQKAAGLRNKIWGADAYPKDRLQRLKDVFNYIWKGGKDSSSEEINEIKKEIKELKAERKAKGLKAMSFMNGGHSPDSLRIATRLFALETKLKSFTKDHELHKSILWKGLRVDIENEAGSVRKGIGPDGIPWEVMLTQDYGYLHGTKGVDGDAIDCFIGPDPLAEFVYVIHTLAAPDFRLADEDKCMLNFANETDARAAFFANYSQPDFFGSLEKFTVWDFLEKVKSTKNKAKFISKLIDKS